MQTDRLEASACPLTTRHVAVTGGSALLADNRCKVPGGREVSERVGGVGTMSGLAVGSSVLRSPVTLCILAVDERYLNVRVAPWRRVRLDERLVGSRDRYEGRVNSDAVSKELYVSSVRVETIKVPACLVLGRCLWCYLGARRVPEVPTHAGSSSRSDRSHGAARSLCMMPLMGEVIRGMASRMVS